MVKKREYDFVTGLGKTSFPSCLKLVNDEETGWAWFNELWSPVLPVTPEKLITIEFNVKQENILYSRSLIKPMVWDGTAWKDYWPTADVPMGEMDWTHMRNKGYPGQDRIVPKGVSAMQFLPLGGAGSKAAPGVTWFDDLKIFQDDVLIYSNDFSNWAPVIIPAEIITGVAMIKFIK